MTHNDLHTEAIKDFGALAFDAIHRLQVECRELTEANGRLATHRDELSQQLALTRMRLEELEARQELSRWDPAE